MELKEKCAVRDGKFIEPCRMLHESGEFGNPSGKKKGVFAWVYSDNQGPTRTMFGVKSGDHVKNGLLFNYCPFCGERIDAPFGN